MLEYHRKHPEVAQGMRDILSELMNELWTEDREEWDKIVEKLKLRNGYAESIRRIKEVRRPRRVQGG